MTTDRCFPLLYCSPEFHNWEEVGYEFVSDSDIAADLAPLSRSECARRGLRHSSDDDHVELEVSSGAWTLAGAMLRVVRGRAERQAAE